MAYYYNYDGNSNREYSYMSRWKLFCLTVEFVKLESDGNYYWKPDEVSLTECMYSGYNIGYLAEANPQALGALMLAPTTYDLLEDLNGKIQPLEYQDLFFILHKFLNKVKGLLQREQPTWNVIY